MVTSSFVCIRCERFWLPQKVDDNSPSSCQVFRWGCLIWKQLCLLQRRTSCLLTEAADRSSPAYHWQPGTGYSFQALEQKWQVAFSLRSIKEQTLFQELPTGTCSCIQQKECALLRARCRCSNWHAKSASLLTLFLPVSWRSDKNPCHPDKGFFSFLLGCYWILYKWWMKMAACLNKQGESP